MAPRRGTIEITADVQVIVTGNKVGPSEAVLLSKLGIKPFTYGLVVKYVYDNGALYDPKASQRCLPRCMLCTALPAVLPGAPASAPALAAAAVALPRPSRPTSACRPLPANTSPLSLIPPANLNQRNLAGA